MKSRYAVLLSLILVAISASWSCGRNALNGGEMVGDDAAVADGAITDNDVVRPDLTRPDRARPDLPRPDRALPPNLGYKAIDGGWHCKMSEYKGKQIWSCRPQSGNLYRCVGNVPMVKVCKKGCIVKPLGQHDNCK